MMKILKSMLKDGARWPLKSIASLIEQEHITISVSILKGTHFEKLVGSITSNFFYLIIIGDQFQDAIRHKKLSDDSTRNTEPNTKKKSFLKKREGDSQIISQIALSPYEPYSTPMHLTYSYPP